MRSVDQSRPVGSAPRQNWIAPLILVCVVACIVMCGLPFVGSYLFLRSLTQPRGHLVQIADWPTPFSNTFGSDEIRVFGLAQFLDERVIAEVHSHDELIQQVIETYDLIPTSPSHPLASQLKQHMLREWNKWQDADGDLWYTTKDFGSVHLEGQDLFLLVTNKQSGRTIIYYNWIF